MKLTDNELDDILAKGGLSLAQPYSPRGSYRKDGHLLTRCNRCGIDAFFPILPGPCSLEQAMEPDTARANLAATAQQVFRLFQAGMTN